MDNSAAYCPLCKANNHCAVANETDTQNCWCQTASISAAAVTEANRVQAEKHCICQQCATQIK